MGSILVDSDEADKSLGKTDKKAEGVGKTFIKGVGVAAKWGVGLAVAAGAGAVALFGVATKAAESTDRIDKLSQKIGLSRKGFQEWDFILSQSGASVESLQGGFKKFSGVIVDASEGNKTAKQSFSDLGLSITDSTGKLKSQEQMFNETIVALQKMEEGPKKAALATDLLGKSASELAPLINGAAGSVEDMRKKANELGLVLSDDAVDAGVKFTDSVDQIKRSMGALVTNIGASVMPMMQGMLEWVSNHMPEIRTVFKVVFDVIGDLVKVVGGFVSNVLIPAFTNLYNWIAPNIPLIKEIMQAAFDNMKLAIQGVIDVFVIIIDWAVKYQAILIPLAAGILGGAIAFGIYTLAIKAHTLVTTIATSVTAAFGAVLAFITSPIGLVVIAIGLLVAAGVLLYKNWDVIKAFMLMLWETLKTKAIEIFTAIWNAIKGAFNATTEWFKNIFTSAWNGIKAVFSGVSLFFNGVWNNIKSVFSGIASWFRNIFQGAWTAIKAVFNGVGTFFSGIWNTIKSKFTTIGTAIGNAIGGAFKSVVNSILGFASNTINGFIRSINGALSLINKIPGVEIGKLKTLNIPRLAKGGVVNKGQIFEAGEDGREVIMPLEKNTGWIEQLAIKLNGKSDKNENGGLTLIIENFVNNSKQDIERIMEEIEFYRKQAAMGR